MLNTSINQKLEFHSVSGLMCRSHPKSIICKVPKNPYLLYNLAIIGITCYMCANYSYWFLLLLLLTGSYKSDRSEEEHKEDF